MTRLVIYHAVPEAMQGTVLYPRNELRKLHPELAVQYDASYAGREDVAIQPIPTLNCNWGDVLFFSPVHPQTIIDELRRAGCPTDFKLRAYEVPLDRLEVSKLTVMVTVALDGDGKRFVSFDPAMLEEWQRIPPITLDYYRRMAAQHEQPFTYGGIPHFLYKGMLDTAGLKVVKTS